MTRTFWIALLPAVILASFAGAAQNGAKVWWPQFRGPNSSGSVKAERLFTLAPTKRFFGQLLWGLDCRRPAFGRDVFF